MKKKNNSSSEGKKNDNKNFSWELTDEELKYVEKEFNDFYRIISESCLDERKYLLEDEKMNDIIKRTFYHSVEFIYKGYVSSFKKPFRDKESKENFKKTALELALALVVQPAYIVFALDVSNKAEDDLRLRATIELLNRLEKELSLEVNKRRTFSSELLKKIKEIEIKTANDIPKPKQIECVILANREIKTYKEEDLIDESGKPTQLAFSIRDAYKSQKKIL